MKISGLLLLIFFCTNVWGEQTTTNHNFTVLLETRAGSYTLKVRAPKDHIALASAALFGVYNKKVKKFFAATVLETGLSTRDIPAQEYTVATERKTYPLHIGLVDPTYVLIAIQATRHVYSTSATREVIYEGNNERLKEMPAVKYLVKFKSGQKTVLLNTHDVELGRIALDIAARLYQHGHEYVGVEVPSRSPRTTQGSCKSLFTH